jgi:hypothetical protein
MARPTEAQVSAAICAAIAAAVPTGKVWNRIRIATSEAEYAAFYVDDRGTGNVWFVRRITITDSVSGFDDILEELHSYELRYARAIVDIEELNGKKASHTQFQEQIETVRAALNADKTLGLGMGTTHSGFQIKTPMPDTAQLGAYEMHMAVAQMDVTVTDC